MTGRIRYVNPKGFAFIERPGEVDVFVHISILRAGGIEFSEGLLGRSVTYELDPGASGPRAHRVRLVEEANA